MKFILAALVVVALVAVSAERTLEFDQYLFTKWIAQHGKAYETLEEFEKRFTIFQQNLDAVQAHNVEARAGKHTFTLKMNQFGDLTNEEYRMRFLGLRGASKKSGLVHPEPANVASLPTTVDWRQKGVVTPVKNQEDCGSCWSFSATGSMEGAYALKYGASHLTSFSEEELVDCANGGQDNCTTGGQMTDGFEWAITNGMETEADYPYNDGQNGQCTFDASKVVTKFSNYTNVQSGSESALQAAAAQQPVSVAIDASSFFFQMYGGGVFNLPSCGNTMNSLDHGVLVVGYGTDGGADYWLVKNSWGASWGLQGYIMMTRNANDQCGIALDASYPSL